MTGPLWDSLPPDWSSGKIRHLGEVTLGKMLQPSRSEGSVQLPYLRAANVQPDGELALEDLRSMWFKPAEVEQLTLQRDDVVVVEGGQGGFGRAAHVSEDLSDFGFQNSINRVRPNDHSDGRFITYYLLAVRAAGYVRAFSNVVSMPHLTAEKLAALPAPVPPLPQQRAIADYLDRETTQIDTLIEEQQRLVEQLVERRGAIITHAVNEGRPERVPLRRLVEVIDCAHVTAEFIDDDQRFPVASIRECQGAEVDLSGCKYTTPAFFEQLRAGGRAPQVGDLLFIRNVSVGLVAEVPPAAPPFALGQETVLLRRTNVDTDPSFLRYALGSAEARHAIEQSMIGSTFRRINVSAIRSLPVPWGPVEGQGVTARHLDAQVTKIDATILETETFIELARERRAALIAAAVTGQIDVESAV